MSNDWRSSTGFGGPVFPGMISPPNNRREEDTIKTPLSPSPTALNQLDEYTSNGIRMMRYVTGRMAAKTTSNSKHTISRSDISNSKKRYTCNQCQYSTDRRDLYRRHENIHRDEKPFHCYVCNKMFNRADHVKKHFLRIHKGLEYNVKLIKRVKGVDYTLSTCNDTDEISNHTTATATATISPINGELKNGDINNNHSNGKLRHHPKEFVDFPNDTQVTLEVKQEMMMGEDVADGHEETSNCNVKVAVHNSLHNNVSSNYDNESHYYNGNNCGIISRLNNNNQNGGILLEVGKASSAFQESLQPLLTTISLPSYDNGQLTICSGHLKSHNSHHRHYNRTSTTHSNHSPDTIHSRSNFNQSSSLKRHNHIYCHNQATTLTSPNSSHISDLELSPSLYKEYGSLPYASLIFNTHPDPKKTKWIHRLNPVRVEASENLESSQDRESYQLDEGCTITGSEQYKDKEAHHQDRNLNHCTVQCRSSGEVCEAGNDVSQPFVCELDDEEELFEDEEDELSISQGEREDEIFSYASSISTDSECSKYECEFCGCAFIDFSSLHTHRYLLHNYLNESEICYPYSCVLCGKRRPTQRLMIRHMERHVRPKVRYYRLICKKTYKVADANNNNNCDKLKSELDSGRNRRKQSRPRKVVKSPLKIIKRCDGHTHRPLKINLSNVRQSSLPSATRLSSSSFHSPRQTQENTNVINSSISEDEEEDEDAAMEEMGKTVCYENPRNLLDNGLRTSNGYPAECRLCHRPFFSRGQPSQKSAHISSYG